MGSRDPIIQIRQVTRARHGSTWGNGTLGAAHDSRPLPPNPSCGARRSPSALRECLSCGTRTRRETYPVWEVRMSLRLPELCNVPGVEALSDIKPHAFLRWHIHCSKLIATQKLCSVTRHRKAIAAMQSHTAIVHREYLHFGGRVRPSGGHPSGHARSDGYAAGGWHS